MLRLSKGLRRVTLGERQAGPSCVVGRSETLLQSFKGFKGLRFFHGFKRLRAGKPRYLDVSNPQIELHRKHFGTIYLCIDAIKKASRLLPPHVIYRSCEIISTYTSFILNLIDYI